MWRHWYPQYQLSDYDAKTTHHNSTSHASYVRIILGMGSANERRRLMITPPLISLAHTQNNLWYGVSVVSILEQEKTSYNGSPMYQSTHC